MLKKLLLAALLLFPAIALSQYTKVTTHQLAWKTLSYQAGLRGNGYWYHTGDTLNMEYGGVRYKLLLAGATDGQALVYTAATKLWSPGAGGTGGATAINDLLTSTNSGTASLATYYQWFTSGNTAGNAPSWRFQGTGTTHSSYLAQFYTSDATSSSKPIGIFARGTANGVEMSSLGAFSYIGTGTINANLWRGSATFDKASQNAQTVYKDQVNTFAFGQTINSTSSISPLTVSSTGNAHGINATTSASNYSAVRGYHTGVGLGVYGFSQSGYGGWFDAQNGSSLGIASRGTLVLNFSGETMIPFNNGVYSLGTNNYRFREIHADSVFSGGIKVTPVLGAKGYFGADDICTFTGLGTDTTYIPSVTIGGDNGQPISFWVEVGNTGQVLVHSKVTGVENIPVYLTIVKRAR